MAKMYNAPCDNCGGRCCSYVAIEIDKPKAKKDFDIIRWYLAHKDVNVFIDHNKNWHIEFRTPCEFHGLDNRCAIYEKRPSICREHGTSEGDCEFYDSPYIEYFASCGEFEQYLDKKGIDWRVKYRT